MTNKEIVERFEKAFLKGDRDTTDRLLAPDFKFNHVANPEPMDRKAYLQVSQALIKAFPDWDFQAKNWNESGNTVTCDIRPKGTQTGTLDLKAIGLPVVESTGKKVEQPQLQAKWTVSNDKIQRIDITGPKQSGLPYILEALGVSVPAQH